MILLCILWGEKMRSYVCIDIGGTSIKYGVIYENGEILVKSKRDTEAYKGGPNLLEKMKDIVREYKDEYIIHGICISTCGMVDPEAGKIIYASNAVPNYIGVEIKKELEKEFELTCEVENDVNCAALGELWLGAAKGAKSCFCMTIGTGIGGCIIIDNHVIHGCTNSAGEVGYMNMDRGTFQEKASTKALVKNVARRKGLMDSEINGEIIFNLAKSGDSICLEEINLLVDTLALGISNIIYVINPEVVVLGGGIMSQKEFLRERLEASLRGKLLEKLYNETKICFAENENDAGMIGALYNYLKRNNLN